MLPCKARMFQAVLAFICLFAYLYHGYLLGERIFSEQRWYVSLVPGLILLTAIQSIIQTAAYYLGARLGSTSDLLSLIGTIACVQLIAFVVKKTVPTHTNIPSPEIYSFKQKIFACINLGIAAFAATIIVRAAWLHATFESIRTPWPLLTTKTLLAVALVWLTLCLSTILTRSRWLPLIHSVLAIGPTLSIPTLLYRVGYGFDGFLHIASEKVLLTSGTLTPKPFYYIGQYVFTTWLSRIADIPIASVDRWLVPVIATFLLPLTIILGNPIDEKNEHTSLLVLGLTPLASFIASTPQALAYVLGLSALLLCRGVLNKTVHWLAPAILVIWSMATHPLAGLPIGCIVLAVLTYHFFYATPGRIFSYGSVLLGGVIVPLLFFIIGSRQGTNINWSISSLWSTAPWLEQLRAFWPFIGNHFVLWPAWASLTLQSLPLVLFTLALWAININRKTKHPQPLHLYLLGAGVFWISATILKTSGDFAFLIDYERGNYAERLQTLALLCLIPAALVGLNDLWNRLRRAPKILLCTFMCFFAAFSTALAYNSLPRHDALVTGRGWSTSIYDIDAVKRIDQDAHGEAYTVLANQSVSAAAVSILGFKRYAEEIFFYPIPTGGPLYQLFLDLTYKDVNRDVIREVGKLGQSKLVYVVIDSYWWQADQLNEELETIADQHWNIGENKVNIYKFQLQ